MFRLNREISVGGLDRTGIIVTKIEVPCPLLFQFDILTVLIPIVDDQAPPGRQNEYVSWPQIYPKLFGELQVGGLFVFVDHRIPHR